MHIHFIGVCGEGVSQVARFFSQLDKKATITFTGSDNFDNSRVDDLRKRISISIPYKEGTITKNNSIVFTCASTQFFPKEIDDAKQNKISVIPIFDLIRIIADTYFYKRSPLLEEYSCTQAEINQMLAIFKPFSADQIVQTAQNTKLIPLFEISSKFKLIGVTGTDGKTTTCSMIYHILKSMGKKVGLTTTVSAQIFDGKKERSIDTGLHVTSPNADQLHNILMEMKQVGCEYAIIETTSHAIAQQRIAGIQFDVVVYTNITNEHLDFHKTWENYVFTKSLLARKYLKPEGKVVLNHDDMKSFKYLVPEIPAVSRIVYRISDTDKCPSNHRICTPMILTAKINNTKNTLGNMHVQISFAGETVNETIPLMGVYNISNYMAVVGALLGVGFTMAQVTHRIKLFQRPKGRMEIVQRRPQTIIVDFAHTPNAMEQLLVSLRNYIGRRNRRIHAVFGCAGFRDTYKRPEMGKIAEKYANFIYVTAEDPRAETLKTINDQIISGMSGIEKTMKIGRFVEKIELTSSRTAYSFFENSPESRRAALKMALKKARPADIIVAMGKGHEQSLCFGTTEHEWSDVEEIRKLVSCS